MPTKLLPLIFTIDVGGRPTVAFEAANLREAHEVCHEHWLLSDLKELTHEGGPLWDGKARLRARYATDDEKAAFRGGARATEEDDLALVYLVRTDRAAQPQAAE